MRTEGLLSCIILAYNNGRFIYDTIDSIIKQDYSKIELIVAEDCGSSFDKKAISDYVKLHARDNIVSVIIYSNPINYGTVKNLNTALSFSHGEYIKIIAADDLYPNTTVFSKQIKYLERNEVLLVAGNCISCDENLKERYTLGFSPCGVENLLHTKDRSKLYKYLVKKELGILSTQSCCFKFIFFQQLGFYDERFRLLEDMPMEKRIVLSGIKIGYMDEACISHRVAGGLSTSNSAFDKRKKVYYMDLLREAELFYSIDNKMLGHIFSKMRIKLCRFRLLMCEEAISKSKKKKILLILENLVPLAYHAFNHPDSIKIYGRNFLK